MIPVHVGLHLGALVASLQLCAGATGADGGGGLFIGYQGGCASGCVSNTSTTISSHSVAGTTGVIKVLAVMSNVSPVIVHTHWRRHKFGAGCVAFG